MVRLAAVLAATLVFTLPQALAQDHGDVHLSLEAGALVTGSVDLDEPTPIVIPGVRAFEAVFEPGLDATDEPGFNATGGFPFGATIAFDVVDALRKWDGASFAVIPPERIAIVLGFNPVIVTPDTPHTLVAGFNFVAANASGGFHQHINFFLDPPASDGVYLLTLRLRCSSAAEPSLPIYIALRQGESAALLQAHEEAIAHINDVLLAPPFCAGDADGSLFVDFDDITAVLANWAASYGGATGAGDADNSGLVDFDDITAVLANWGATCD